MSDLNKTNERTLYLTADGARLDDDCRIRVRGRSTMTCVPDAWQIDVSGLSSFNLAMVRRASVVSVLNENGSTICAGRPFSVGQHSVAGRLVDTISINDGEDFWRSSVNLAIRGGASVVESIRTMIQSCSVAVPLASVPSSTARMPRGQSYFGRTPDALTSLVSGLGWRAFTYQGALYIISQDQGLDRVTLTDADLLDEPNLDNGSIRTKTEIEMRRPGQLIELKTRAVTGTFRLVAVTIDADNYSGPWTCEYTLMNEIIIDRGWEGI